MRRAATNRSRGRTRERRRLGRAFRATLRAPFLTLLAVGVVAASGDGAAAAGAADAGSPAFSRTAPVLDAALGSVYTRYYFHRSDGESRVDQQFLPVNLSWHTRYGVTAGAGADLVYNRVGTPLAERSATDASDLRFSLESSWLRHRLRAAIQGTVSLLEASRAWEEDILSETLENAVLRLPWIRSSSRSRLRLTAAGQPLRRESLVAQLGAAYEIRPAYDLQDGGPRFDPGNRLQMAAGLQAARRSWNHRWTATIDLRGQSRVGQGEAFRPGTLWSLRYAADWNWAAGRRLGLQAGWASRTEGEVVTGQALQDAYLRGGSLLDLRLSVRRAVGSGEAEVFLGRGELRSLAGDLGHGGWFDPGLAYSRPLAGGLVSARLSVPWGHLREGRGFHGFSFSWGWGGRIL